jgi:hypothetical protein
MVGFVLLITLLLFATETTFTKQLGSKKVKKINFCLQKSNDTYLCTALQLTETNQ